MKSRISAILLAILIGSVFGNDEIDKTSPPIAAEAIVWKWTVQFRDIKQPDDTLRFESQGKKFERKIRLKSPNLKEIAISPSGRAIAFYDGLLRKILIFNLDEHLESNLKQQTFSDSLLEIWWDKNARKEILYPVDMRWADDNSLCIIVLARRDDPSNTLMVYRQVPLRHDNEVYAAADSIWENPWGRVKNVKIDKGLVQDYFERAKFDRETKTFKAR